MALAPLPVPWMQVRITDYFIHYSVDVDSLGKIWFFSMKEDRLKNVCFVAFFRLHCLCSVLGKLALGARNAKPGERFSQRNASMRSTRSLERSGTTTKHLSVEIQCAEYDIILFFFCFNQLSGSCDGSLLYFDDPAVVHERTGICTWLDVPVWKVWKLSVSRWSLLLLMFWSYMTIWSDS